MLGYTFLCIAVATSSSHVESPADVVTPWITLEVRSSGVAKMLFTHDGKDNSCHFVGCTSQDASLFLKLHGEEHFSGFSNKLNIPQCAPEYFRYVKTSINSYDDPRGAPKPEGRCDTSTATSLLRRPVRQQKVNIFKIPLQKPEHSGSRMVDGGYQSTLYLSSYERVPIKASAFAPGEESQIRRGLLTQEAKVGEGKLPKH